MRLLWVVPRFGSATVGGAERLVRGLASRALPEGWSSEIATTCAVNHETWSNELDPGVFNEDGLVVRRFRVGPRDDNRYWQLHASILSGQADYADELEWLANSVWSPDLQRFLEDKGRNYDLILFSPYLFGTTIWGTQVGRSAVPSFPACMTSRTHISRPCSGCFGPFVDAFSTRTARSASLDVCTP